MASSIHTITDDLDVSTLRPLEDHVLMQVVERQKTSGGILLPKGKGTEVVLGRVIATGPGVPDEVRGGYFPMGLSKGDYVIAMDYAGERLETPDGRRYRLIRSHGVWAKVTLKDKETYDFAAVEPRMSCVLLRPQDETKLGSLYLANGLSESQNRRGKVVAVGPGMWHRETGRRDPIPLKVDQQVAFMRYAGAEVEVDGEWLRIVVEDDVRCIVEGMK